MLEGTVIGIGLYSIPEAARLLCAPSRKVRRWVKGYTYGAEQDRRFSAPVVRHQRDTLHEADILTFAELIELQFVAIFRNRRISMEIIRGAANYLAKRWNTDYPFTLKRISTDGVEIFGTMEALQGQGRYPVMFIEALHNQQLAFPDLIEPYLEKIEYDGQIARQFWPLGKDGRVVLDPARSFGKPIDDETGMRTHILYQAAGSGESYESLARWYRVPVQAIEQAVAYEESLQVA